MRIPKWIFVAAPAWFAVFITIGGWIVMSLWNWLGPELFGLRQVTFWQALGLLVLCRILFPVCALVLVAVAGIPGSLGSRMFPSGWSIMTPEERESLRQSWHGRWASVRPTPIPGANRMNPSNRPASSDREPS